MKRLSSAHIDLLIYMHRKGEATNSRSGLHSLAFYPVIRTLRNLGLVDEQGKTERNEKRWLLTENGKKVAGHYNGLNEIWKERDK